MSPKATTADTGADQEDRLERVGERGDVRVVDARGQVADGLGVGRVRDAARRAAARRGSRPGGWRRSRRRAAIPIEPPICRKRSDPDVATPISLWSTEFWTASTSTCMTIPIPTPTTSMQPAAVQIELPVPSRESRSRPTVMTNVPTIGNTLYRPEREITRPLTIEVASSPSISGSSWRPELGRALALDDLEEHRHVDDRAEQREPDGEADRARGDEDPVAEQRERHDRLARSRLGKDEQRQEHRRDHDEADDLRRAPVVGRAAEADRQNQRGEPAGEERGAEPVDPVPDALDRGVEDDADDHEARRSRSAG